MIILISEGRYTDKSLWTFVSYIYSIFFIVESSLDFSSYRSNGFFTFGASSTASTLVVSSSSQEHSLQIVQFIHFFKDFYFFLLLYTMIGFLVNHSLFSNFWLDAVYKSYDRSEPRLWK